MNCTYFDSFEAHSFVLGTYLALFDVLVNRYD